MPVRPLVAMVALRDKVLPPASRILDLLQDSIREIPPVSVTDDAGDRMTLTIGDATATLSLEPAPIEAAELDAACRAAWYWPEAAERFRGHAAHVPVVLLAEDEDRVNAALLLTSLVAAVAASSDAVGVYWAASGLVQPPEAFVSYCQEGDEELLPLNLWIDFRLLEGDDGAYSLATTGLEDFGLSEIEVPPSRHTPELVLERAFKMAHYLLENGPILEDGETVELSDDEKLVVHFGPSMWDPSLSVLRLEIDATR